MIKVLLLLIYLFSKCIIITWLQRILDILTIPKTDKQTTLLILTCQGITRCISPYPTTQNQWCIIIHNSKWGILVTIMVLRISTLTTISNHAITQCQHTTTIMGIQCMSMKITRGRKPHGIGKSGISLLVRLVDQID